MRLHSFSQRNEINNFSNPSVKEMLRNFLILYAVRRVVGNLVQQSALSLHLDSLENDFSAF